jgi:transposase-like protein
MKKEVWQAHVDAYNSSKQSVMAYANQHGLVYSQMLYWTRKLRNEPKKNNNPEPAFVAIEIKNTEPTPSALGILEFPSGIKLHIHNAELLNNIPNLWTGKP